MRKAIVHKLESALGYLPLVDDGFESSDYAKEIGIALRTARERLAKLASDGVVRRVRIRRLGTIRQGWQIVETRK